MRRPDNWRGQTYNHRIRATTLCLTVRPCAGRTVCSFSLCFCVHSHSFITYNLCANVSLDGGHKQKMILKQLQTVFVLPRERRGEEREEKRERREEKRREEKRREEKRREALLVAES